MDDNHLQSRPAIENCQVKRENPLNLSCAQKPTFRGIGFCANLAISRSLLQAPLAFRCAHTAALPAPPLRLLQASRLILRPNENWFVRSRARREFPARSSISGIREGWHIGRTRRSIHARCWASASLREPIEMSCRLHHSATILLFRC